MKGTEPCARGVEDLAIPLNLAPPQPPPPHHHPHPKSPKHNKTQHLPQKTTRNGKLSLLHAGTGSNQPEQHTTNLTKIKKEFRILHR